MQENAVKCSKKIKKNGKMSKNESKNGKMSIVFSRMSENVYECRRVNIHDPKCKKSCALSPSMGGQCAYICT